MKKKNKFAPTTEGFQEAKAYLLSINAWGKTCEQLDGYSLVHHANSVYIKNKKQ